MYALPPYAYLSKDFTTQAALYTHHQYIAGFLMVGAFAHGAIFFVRDYDPEQNKNNVLARMLEHKEAIISHLSWASLFLGFHTLGLYIHNDVVAFGTTRKTNSYLSQFLLNGFKQHLVKQFINFDVLLSSSTSVATAASNQFGYLVG
jgi:photosystem I P700 chlorophyll a apoprotein A2